jgi:hypothetical protein
VLNEIACYEGNAHVRARVPISAKIRRNVTRLSRAYLQRPIIEERILCKKNRREKNGGVQISTDRIVPEATGTETGKAHRDCFLVEVGSLGVQPVFISRTLHGVLLREYTWRSGKNRNNERGK